MAEGISSNSRMSRRTIALLCVFISVLLVVNVVVLAIWLPNRKSKTDTAPASGLTSAAPAVVAATPVVAAAGPNAALPQQRMQPPAPPAGFALERQVPSASGNLEIQYLRDRNSKMRRIAVDDAHRPGSGTVLCESKHTVWAMISPDDQWIVVAERSPTGEGNIRLYHRSNNSAAQFAPTQDNAGDTLQDTVWKAYLAATDADPNTSRHGATINAMAWENDSRRVDLSVAYLPGANNPEVPAPWSCTYDITSKQVTPTSRAAADQPEQESASSDQQSSDQSGANNPSASNDTTDSGVDESADNEFPGEKFPATRLDELTAPDVNESSLDEVNYAINEMYARHGVDFKDKKVSGQFSGFSWYKSRAGFGAKDAEAEFSDLENQNLKVLERCRDAKIAAARRNSHPVHGQQVEEESTGQKILRGLRTWQDAGAPMPPHP